MPKKITKTRSKKSRKNSPNLVGRIFPFLTKISPSAFLTVGLVLLMLSLTWKVHSQTRYSFSSTNFAYQQSEDRVLPTFLYIEKINISISISEARIQGNEWEIKEDGVSYLVNSAVPGENGNIVLYSHNTQDRFASLPNLQKGDEIVIVSKDGKRHVYIVSQTMVVSPNDVWVVENNNKEELTLYTCYGFADLKRFVVKAFPQEN